MSNLQTLASLRATTGENGRVLVTVVVAELDTAVCTKSLRV